MSRSVTPPTNAPRVAFTKHEQEIADRLRMRETAYSIWLSLFNANPKPVMTYSYFARLIRRYLPDLKQPSASYKPKPPAQAPQEPLPSRTYDPAISGTGPRPLPPPLPKMPDSIVARPIQAHPTTRSTGPVPGSIEWKKLHGLETPTGRRNLIEQRVPDGSLSGDEN